MSPTYTLAKDIARISKEINPEIKVVIGGPHPSVMPEHALSDNNVDVAVIGEGEYTVLDLVKSFDEQKKLSDVNGIFYKTPEGIKRTPKREYINNLDELPFPARDLLEMKYYLSKVMEFPFIHPFTHLVALRGCPFNCYYCQPTARDMFGAKVRYRSPENIVDEMELITNEYNIGAINIGGDTVTMDKKWFHSLCDKIIERNIDVNWYIGTRVDLVDREMLQHMKKAGGYYIVFGVESGSKRILDDIMHKGTSIEQTVNAFKLCREIGIMARANLMFGSPTETKYDVMKTYQLLKEIQPDVTTLAITNPIPGTKLFDDAINNGLILTDNYSEITRQALGKMVRELDDKELKQCLKLFWYTTMTHQMKFTFMPWTKPYYLEYALKRDWSILKNKGILYYLKTNLFRSKEVLAVMKDTVLTVPWIKMRLLDKNAICDKKPTIA